jgi:hypothetical protein
MLAPLEHMSRKIRRVNERKLVNNNTEKNEQNDLRSVKNSVRE